MLSTTEAVELLNKYIENENLKKHCFATQVSMEYLARKLGEDEKKWSIAGLLHDIDYTETFNNPEQHGLVGSEILEKLGLPEDIVYAVKVHNEMHNLPRKSLLDKVLYAVDPLTGLIVAAALIRPEKKLSVLDVPFLIKRFNEKSFAKGACREQIASCKDFAFSLEEFMGVVLEAMQSIDKKLGL